MSKSTPRLTRPPGAGLDPKFQALYENLEILNGARGDGMDRSVLMRDLIDLGIITAKKGVGGKVVPSLPGEEGGLLPPGEEAIEPPGIPKNVIATGGFSSILIEWDTPTYSGHAYTEILRANVDNFSVAVRIGTTAANLYSDSVGADKAYFYWVRFVNKSDVKGPIQSTSGVEGKTEADIGDILDQLKGQIDESFLTPKFDNRINDYGDGISKNERGIVTLEGEVIDVKTETEVLSISADITSEGLADVAKGRDEEGSTRRRINALIQKDQKVLFTKTGAMAQEIQEVSVRVGDNAASIVDTKTSIIKLDEKTGEAISVVTERLDTQSSNIGDISAKVTTNTTTIAKVDSKTDANGKEISRVETSITSRMNSMSSTIGSNSSSITSNEQTLVEVGKDIKSVTDRVTVVESNVGSISSKVSQHSQAIATINADGSSAYKAQWGVKASIGDIQAGIGLTVKKETGKPDVSQCTVIADQFSVGSIKDGKTIYPFVVTTDGVYIDTAYIKAAKIQDLVAGEVVADNIKAAATLTAPQIKGGTIEIGSRFTVDENGNVVATNANLSGVITATGGSFNNVVIEKNCTIRGRLDGADGTFLGTVYAQNLEGDIVSAKVKPVTSQTVTARNRWTTAFSAAYRSSKAINRSIYVFDLHAVVSGVSLDNYKDPGSIRLRVRVNSNVVLTKIVPLVVANTYQTGDEGGTVEVTYKASASISGGAYIGLGSGNIFVDVYLGTSSGLTGAKIEVPTQNVMVQLVPVGTEII